jgi:glycosyltransferase involved in cell wall biosynthesis
MCIKILYRESNNYGGIPAYSRNLLRELSQLLPDVVGVKLPQLELHIGNVRIGGNISRSVFSNFVKKSKIMHSTDYLAYTKNTNIVTIHDLFALINPQSNMSFFDKKYKLKLLNKINGVRYIIVQVPQIAEQVRRYVKEVPIAVIPSKIFIGEASMNPYPSNGKIHLLTFGDIKANQFNRKKIKDIYEYVANKKGIELYHIGSITEKSLINYAENIHQLGVVSEPIKYNWLKYADKFVYKSLGEGQGLPVMEAMRFGVQPIINDLDEFRFLLGDRPYYFHNEDEFLEMIYKQPKTGLFEQITKYDNWIDKYKKVYDEVMT